MKILLIQHIYQVGNLKTHDTVTYQILEGYYRILQSYPSNKKGEQIPQKHVKADSEYPK